MATAPTLYQTDERGFFTETLEALESPLEPGVWLVPAGAVFVPPPAVLDGQSAQWNPSTNSWGVVSILPSDNPVIAGPPTGEMVDLVAVERTMNLFRFTGKLYQLDQISQNRISALGSLAMFAMLAGHVAGDLRWSDPDKDFVFIASDNTEVPMDASTMAALAQSAMKWVSANIFAARALKSTDPIPYDYAADVHWPISGA